MMAQGVNAVKSEVPMPQFTATLSNLCFSPDVTARDNLYAHDVILFDYYIWVCMLPSFCCCILYAHIGWMNFEPMTMCYIYIVGARSHLNV